MNENIDQPRRREATSTSAPLLLCAFAFSFLLLSFGTPARARQEDDLLASLTLEQKVAQMFMVNVYGSQLPEVGRDFLRKWQPGAIILFEHNAGTPEAITSLTNAMQQTVIDAGGLPMLVATDQEMGIIATFEDRAFTEWPVPMLVTATGDEDLAYRVGQALAQELHAVGVNMDLAPVADLNTNLNNPIIGRRSFGTNPELTGRILAAVVRGMQDGGVLAAAKHFPGHGDTSTDSHTSLPVVTQGRKRLETVELVPFQMTIDAGVASVMVAHVWYPALESQERMPASLSHAIITGLLREEMGYTGIVMTDALEMDAIDTVYRYDQAALMAIKAGVDLVAFGGHTGLQTQDQAMQAVVDAVRRGELLEERIDASVRRILETKARFGLLDWQPLDPVSARERIGLDDHKQLVDALFRAGITVAVDENNVIPFSENSRVAFVFPANRQAIMRECGQYHPSMRWVGISNSPTGRDITFAVDAAGRVDTVVVFTQNAYNDSGQQKLVQSLPPEKTVVVALWSPYDWMRFPDISGYVVTYSPLSPSIPAVCAVLFGEITARGQLAVDLSAELPAGSRSR